MSWFELFTATAAYIVGQYFGTAWYSPLYFFAGGAIVKVIDLMLEARHG
jgi:hypothetical protein